MSSENVNDPNAVMMQRVAVPSCFAKLAADVGYTPSSSADADRILRLGDMLKQAVDGHLDARDAAGKSVVSDAVKQAMDVAFEAAGFAEPEPVKGAAASDFLLDDLVKQAAAAVFDAKVQAAADAARPAEAPAPAATAAETPSA